MRKKSTLLGNGYVYKLVGSDLSKLANFTQSLVYQSEFWVTIPKPSLGIKNILPYHSYPQSSQADFYLLSRFSSSR